MDKLRDLVRREMPKDIVAVVVVTSDMNPIMGIGIPCRDLCGGLAIGIVHATPTNRNRDPIGESHRESTIVIGGDKVETVERIRNGIGVRHCVFPMLVSLNAPDRIRTYDLVFRKDPRYPLRYGSNPKLSLSPCEHRRQLPFFDVLVVSYPIEHRVIVIDHQCSVALIQHLIAFTKYRCLCVVW